jgi:DNA repair protein RadC
MKLKKGSKEAKAFMAKIRAAKDKPKKVGSKPTKIVKANSKTIKKGFKNPFGMQYANTPEIRAAIKNEVDEILKRVRAKKLSGWNKGGTFIIETDEKKPVNAKKVIKVERRKVVKAGTFKNFTRVGAVSGYKQTPEVILGKVGGLTLLKSLAPEVKLRILRGKKIKDNKLTSAKETVEVLKKFLTPAKIQTQEYALAIFLNNNSNVLAVYQFGMGGFTATVMDKRLLMAAALKLGATAIILCHNHPSGSLKPSSADYAITKDIKQLAQIHDINVLDHIIVTKDGYYSFAENGDL